ncbi:hypothetical protein BCR44DRAFT_33795 [Catenaria anguillulae PL171]|uniref:PX domain-containing protein n=1 Tax=Catenaria anguillulae PL171 TaxID=765915 RepID=A0A1Y2HN11_9FUNG|nr:hypothetical protein BCR44DRAFT_33795 [Catenaria anguillulae PL171]
MLATTPNNSTHHHHNHAATSVPPPANMTANTAQKQVKWAPGLGQPSDVHVALLEPDMAWDDARLARILRTDCYLSVTVSPQLTGLVRSYSCFADLHSQLLLAHPHESGRTGKMPRSLPFLPDWPAQLDRNTSHRLVRGLATYLQELAALPAHILHHESVVKFCEPPAVPRVPQEQQPAQLSSSGVSPPLGEQMTTNGRAWSTMSNASNSDPSLPRGRHPNASSQQQPPQRVTSTASSGVSLNIPKHMSGGLGDSSSAPVSPVNGSFHHQRNQRGTVFPRGSSLPPSPSSSHFPDYPPLPPAPDHHSPTVPSRTDSPRFAPRSASQPRDPAEPGLPPQRVRSREQSMAGSSLSHTSSGSSHSRPPMPPPPAASRPQQQQQSLHHHSSSPHLPPRSVSSNVGSYGDDGAPPPPRRSASSASSSRPASALPPPASPYISPSGAPSPSLPPLPDPSTPSVATPSVATPSSSAATQDMGDKTLKIKLVFPKIQHVAAVRIRLDALSMGTLLTAVESKVDQAHAERPGAPRPQQYTICYRVPEGQEGGGRSVKVNQQTWPGIVREVVRRGEEKVVLYMLY